MKPQFLPKKHLGKCMGKWLTPRSCFLVAFVALTFGFPLVLQTLEGERDDDTILPSGEPGPM